MTPVVDDLLDLRNPLPWSALRPGQARGSGWNTATFDDRSWAYAVAPLIGGQEGAPTIADVGPVGAVRTQFTADPTQPLRIIVRAIPDATLFVNGIAIIEFPPTSRPSAGQLAPARRLDRPVLVESRILTSGINVAAIDYPSGQR